MIDHIHKYTFLPVVYNLLPFLHIRYKNEVANKINPLVYCGKYMISLR